MRVIFILFSFKEALIFMLHEIEHEGEKLYLKIVKTKIKHNLLVKHFIITTNDIIIII